MEEKKEKKGEKSEKKLVFAKTTYDVQRLRLEKMMQNPVRFRLMLYILLNRVIDIVIILIRTSL